MNQRYQLSISLLTILLLTTFAAVGTAQNNANPENAKNSTAAGSRVSGTADAKDEIAKMLRDFYDAFGRMEAQAMNNLADDGFLSLEGSRVTNTFVKAKMRSDFAATPASQYQFAIEDLKVFPLTADTAVANYRVIITERANGQKRSESLTDTLIRRDGRWQIFAEHFSDIPKPAEPIVPGLPTGWARSKRATANRYLINVDTVVKHAGKASVSIKFACGEDQNALTYLVQAITPDEYRGKRLRLSGWLKTVDASKAKLWMRVVGEQRDLGFDDIDDRAATGTSEWKMYSVVLNIPAAATNIFFGVQLEGKGQVWAHQPGSPFVYPETGIDTNDLQPQPI